MGDVKSNARPLRREWTAARRPRPRAEGPRRVRRWHGGVLRVDVVAALEQLCSVPALSVHHQFITIKYYFNLPGDTGGVVGTGGCGIYYEPRYACPCKWYMKSTFYLVS